MERTMVNIERWVLRRIDALVMESKATCTTAFEEIRSVTADHSSPSQSAGIPPPDHVSNES
jgi:hypothetical protein